MAFFAKSGTALVYMLRPGIEQIFNREWDKLWPFRRRPDFQMDISFESNDILFATKFGTMTLANEFEIQGREYRRMADRFEYWLSKHMPRPHRKYVPKPQIRRPRRPSEE